MQQGVVVKSTGSWYQVRTDSGDIIASKIRGKLRLKGIRSTNPIAVGDKVNFELDDAGVGQISSIEPRINYIIRKSVNLSKAAHIIAANIDQAFLLVTLKEPETMPAFIDRFLVTAEAYHIPSVLIFNKIDTYTTEELEVLETFISIYENIGYECLRVSALNGKGLAVLKEKLNHKTTLLSGHSGVGKSTLINAVDPNLNLKTLKISAANKTGQHTTTFAEMFPLEFGGYIIDTPGIKGFGLVDFDKTEIAERFPEMRELMDQCKYSNCLHIDEPNCAVKEAVEKGQIAISRYESYMKLYFGEHDEHYRKDQYS
jgi:ribosome biogenesis GTPase